MRKLREKTINYRRAIWINDDDGTTLEVYLKYAFTKLKRVEQRKVARLDGQILKAITKRELRSGGILIHLVAETPGDHASTIHVSHDAREEGEVHTSPPPIGAEFMDGDIFAFVMDNHVCVCATVLKDRALSFYLKKMFELAGLGTEVIQFELQKVANLNKISLINAEGVKEIHLNASLSEAAMHLEQRKYRAAGMLDAVRNSIRKNFGSDAASLSSNIQVGLF